MKDNIIAIGIAIAIFLTMFIVFAASKSTRSLHKEIKITRPIITKQIEPVQYQKPKKSEPAYET